MFPLSTKGGGVAFAFPDTCKLPPPPVPPVPVPFPNTALLNQANGGTCSKNVKVLNKAVITKATQVPRTMGDEPGTVGGVVSGVNMGPASFKVGSAKVKVEGNEAVTQLKTSAHNGSNANAPMGSVLAPSQTKVLVSG